MEWVQQYGREQLTAARTGSTGLRLALCRYMKQGLGAGFSTGELVDWLGVSSPSILDAAGFDDADAAAVMELLCAVSDAEIESTRIGPDPYLP